MKNGELVKEKDGRFIYYFHKPVRLKVFRSKRIFKILGYYDLELTTDEKNNYVLGLEGEKAAILTYLRDNNLSPQIVKSQIE